MIWIVVGGVLALVGVGALVAYTAILVGKGKDVVAEAKVVQQRLAQARELTRAIQLPHSSRN